MLIYEKFLDAVDDWLSSPFLRGCERVLVEVVGGYALMTWSEYNLYDPDSDCVTWEYYEIVSRYRR